MAKRILVNEGDKIKTISNVSKLVTRLQNGNMCIWVPEDELLLATKTIVKDGTYKAASEAGSPYGYSQVTVNGVGSQIFGELFEKSITKNGTYRASEDKDGPFYGYSKVYVGVSGGGGGGGGGEPQEPIGGNDEDGDPAIAEVDDDGHIVFTKAPTFIRVTKDPTITEYNVGQTINYSGIEVTAYIRANEVWTHSRYPDGKIPFEELIFPITVVREGSSNIYAKNVSIVRSAGSFLGAINDRSFYKAFNGDAIVIFNDTPNLWTGPVLISTTKNGATYTVHGTRPPISGNPTNFEPYASFSYDNMIWYINWGAHYKNPNPKNSGGFQTVSWSQIYYNNNEAEVIPFLEEHEVSGDDRSLYPVEWKRLGDRQVLRTSVRIYATDD